MTVTLILTQITSRLFRAEVPGLSAVTREAITAEEALNLAMDGAALYLDPKEPEFIEFEVKWSDGRPYEGS